jgi:hypothetical protein
MREEILEGELGYPGFAILLRYPDQMDDIRAFWRAIWLNYLSGNDTNGVNWYDKLGCKLYNELVRNLSHHGWVTSHSLTGRKWISIELNTDKLLEFVTPDELGDVKTACKYRKYVLDRKESTASTLVRQNGKTRRTGLVREGFRDAGNTEFGYDTATLGKYEDAVKLNLTKSMDKVRESFPEMKSEDFSYDTVSTGIFDWHYDNAHETFTTGDNISDSRGRAISSCLGRVANPIGDKCFRSALVITYNE